MILPKNILDNVKYYEADPHVTDDGLRKYSRITIHFKQWYKRKKTFYFRWVPAEEGYIKPSPSFRELEEQLYQHFAVDFGQPNKDNVTYLSEIK